jgi:hypothetical protein
LQTLERRRGFLEALGFRMRWRRVVRKLRGICLGLENGKLVVHVTPPV